MILPEFANKIAVITGAASGLGLAISKILVDSGCRVILLDNNQESLFAAMKELGEGAEGKIADVTNFEIIRKIVNEIADKYGTIDYFFNNAGIALLGEVRDISIEDWNSILAVDLHGVVNGVAAAYPIMLRQKSGHIVNISSIDGLIPAVMLIPYTTAKFGVVGLSHSLRIEAKRLGVKVTVACPNLVNTAIWSNSKVKGCKLQTPKDFLKLFGCSQQKLQDADKAALIILKGVLKNKATILNDCGSRLLWWFYRLCPTLWMWVYDTLIMQKLRSVRK